MLCHSIHIVTSQRRSSECGYLKTEINVDGYSGEVLLLGHVGELHYVSLDKVSVPVATTEQPAMSPEKCLPTVSSKASVCGHCESQCCTKNEPNQPVSEETLKKTSRCYVTKGKKKTRCVQTQWFETFNWLTLRESRLELFCCICRHEDNRGSLTSVRTQIVHLLATDLTTGRKVLANSRVISKASAIVKLWNSFLLAATLIYSLN